MKRERGLIQRLVKFFWIALIISGTREAKEFKFGWNIHRVHQNKSPLKIVVKRDRGPSRDCTNFLGTTNYLRNG